MTVEPSTTMQIEHRVNRLEDRFEEVIELQARTETQLSSVAQSVQSLIGLQKEQSEKLSALATRQSATNWSILVPLVGAGIAVTLFVVASFVNPVDTRAADNAVAISTLSKSHHEALLEQAYRDGVLDTKIGYIETRINRKGEE